MTTPVDAILLRRLTMANTDLKGAQIAYKRRFGREALTIKDAITHVERALEAARHRIKKESHAR